VHITIITISTITVCVGDVFANVAIDVFTSGSVARATEADGELRQPG